MEACRIVDDTVFTCPRCFRTAPLAAAGRFCPRCGLIDVKESAGDTAPLDLVSRDGKTYRVEDRIALGTICNVYRCRFRAGHDGAPVEGVFKIARDARVNPLLANEAAILQHLHRADNDGRARPFLPAFEATLNVTDNAGAPPRAANVLRNHPEIHSPDELFTLAEVRAQYPAGIDARDMAWIWRRLLSVLGFAHASGVVHRAVLPGNVLIEPAGHKLVLADWCFAARQSDGGGVRTAASAPYTTDGGHRDWYRREAASDRPPVPALDVALGARCMIELMGGDAVRGELPPAVEPAIGRYFGRCIDTPARVDTPRLLDDFDRLIEVLWGPRTFRPFEMPARARPPRQGV